MPAVDMFHEPVDMQKMVSEVEPCVKYKQINEDLFDGFNKSKFILFSFPVTIIWHFFLKFPHPYSGVEQHTEKCNESHLKLFLD